MLNVNMYDTCCRTTLLQWTIFTTGDDRLSLNGFYQTLDTVGDHELAVSDVTQTFGRFLISSMVCEDLPPARDAFQVMFATQRQLNSMKFPPIINVQHGWHVLFLWGSTSGCRHPKVLESCCVRMPDVLRGPH